MTFATNFAAALERCPLVAILRGVRADEVEDIGEALVAAGFSLIEVPLNSPKPFESIRRLSRRLGARALVGAGTVLRVEQIIEVEAAGGALIVSPNADRRVIGEAANRGLVSLPGISTPTEAFDALEAGATALKLFPAEAAVPAVVKAMLAVLPAGTRVLAVGGITPDSMKSWLVAGAAGFGLGSALYTPGMSASQVSCRAKSFVRALA